MSSETRTWQVSSVTGGKVVVQCFPTQAEADACHAALVAVNAIKPQKSLMPVTESETRAFLRMRHPGHDIQFVGDLRNV